MKCTSARGQYSPVAVRRLSGRRGHGLGDAHGRRTCAAELIRGSKSTIHSALGLRLVTLSRAPEGR